jgi:TetR/AcrR family transcriptional regulator, cholesterol catabolism regulator
LKGSLYHYISNKEQVLFELIRSYHDETRTYFEPIHDSEDPPLVKLRRFIETETVHTAHNLMTSSLFFTEWRSLSPEHRQRITAERDRHDRFVQDCIVEAQKRGEVRLEVDARLASYGILGMLSSVYRWYNPDGPASAEQIGAEFADLAIKGLAGAAA